MGAEQIWGTGRHYQDDITVWDVDAMLRAMGKSVSEG